MERTAGVAFVGERTLRQSSAGKHRVERQGNNQPLEERDVQEQPDKDGDDGGAVHEEERDGVRRFSVLSESSELSPVKRCRSPEVIQPDSETSDDPSVEEQEEEEEEETEAQVVEQRYNKSTESDQVEGTAYVDVQQQQQMQDDIEVLASHLQLQTQELETQRSLNESLLSQLHQLRHTAEQAMESIRIENNALQHRNALLVRERDESQQRAQSAAETHDELLSALRQQQQREDHARTIVTALVKERDVLKKQLDESKTYCRRLEDDAVALRAEQQHLKGENKTLLTAIKATKQHHNNDRELAVICEQEQLIQSLRADLVQMEFEFKTLSVDKDKLTHRLATLQRQSECRSTSYDVISLKGDGDAKTKTKTRLSVITTSSSSSKHHNDSAMGEGFSNLMTLPNSVEDDPNTMGPRTSTVGSGVMLPRARTPMGSLVSKTLFSAKKKLFQLSTSHTTTVVIPQ